MKKEMSRRSFLKAGTAAAMCDDFDNIDIKLLQQKLTENGVRL